MNNTQEGQLRKDVQIHINLDASDCNQTSLPLELKNSIEEIINNVINKVIKKGYGDQVTIKFYSSMIQSNSEKTDNNTVVADLLFVTKNELKVGNETLELDPVNPEQVQAQELSEQF